MSDIELSCVSFAEKLASKAPTTGGGGAAALTGALAAALCSMAGNFTIGKKKYADVEKEVAVLLEKAEILRAELLELVGKDADAFEPLSKAYSYPKDAPDRDEVFEKAAKNACQAPLAIVQKCAAVMDLLEEMGNIGSKMLISDVGCGAYLCQAAMESAALNVFINTKSLKNRETAEKMDTEVLQYLDRNRKKHAFIVSKVSRVVR